MAVGSQFAAQVQFAESWNGSRWTQESVPAARDGDLWGVACSSPTACVAVGTQASGTLADVWNGTTWTQTSMPYPGPGELLTAVACPITDSCIAVGRHTTDVATGTMLAERWNGKTWTLMPFADAVAGGNPNLFSVSCTTPSTCTAVGDPNPERWNGTLWAPQSIRNNTIDNLFSVACPTNTTCTAVGAGFYGSVTLRWRQG